MRLAEEHKDYLWRHFEFNAEQRLKAFNFFVVLSVFANGGILTAIEKGFSPVILLLIAGFVVAVSVVLCWIDLRSNELLNLAVPGLMSYEEALPEQARIFTIDAKRPKLRLARYTVAFRTLFGMQFLFGLGVFAFALRKFACS
jgi:hypothetical protein